MVADTLDSVKVGTQLINTDGIVGAIGSLTSVVTIPLSYTFSATEIPLCSGASTASDLSDKTDFPYFFRAIPSDLDKANALADFVFSMGWSKVGVISSSDDYGQGMLVTFQQRCATLGISIETSQSIVAGTANTDAEIAPFKVQQIRIVVVLALPTDFITVLRSARDAGILTFEFVYIGAELDGLNQLLMANETGTGMITGVLYAKPNDIPSQELQNQWDAYVIAK